MTENFKSILKEYLVGNVDTTNPAPKQRFDEVTDLSNTLWNSSLPEQAFLSDSIVDKISNKIILYGWYNQDGESKGFITILNDSYNPEKTFFTYNDGTYIKPIQCMRQAEDGTYYLVDKTTHLRLVMVNNFSQQDASGNYSLKFRKNYNFDSSFDNYNVKEMYKSGTSSEYLFFSEYESNIKTTELKVNVGEANEWKTITTTGRYFIGGYAFFNENGVFWRMITSNSSNKKNIIIYTKTESSETAASTNIGNIDLSSAGTTNKDNALFYDKNNIYFVIYEDGAGGGVGFYKYSFDDNTLKTIFLKTWSLGYGEYINISQCNNSIYVEYIKNLVHVDEEATLSFLNGWRADYFYQRLEDDVWNPVEYKTYTRYGYVRGQHLFISKADFNLVQLFSVNIPYEQRFLFLVKDNYNVLNYYGQSYVDYNSMIPEQIEVYSNNSLVFARNILDKTLIDNKTISTVVIPNIYLNGINMDGETLLSETNIELVNQSVPLTKNIYEMLYLNFINNITNTYYFVDYPSEALTPNIQISSTLNSYVNQNINVGTKENSESVSMGYMIVNYVDGTTIANPITWEIVNTSDPYEYNFALDVQKEIVSYEIKSNDLQQTYIEVFPTNLEVGNVYKITQYFNVS